MESTATQTSGKRLSSLVDFISIQSMTPENLFAKQTSDHQTRPSSRLGRNRRLSKK
jgi:hypothetical protein